jgi:MFS-type transporter involved in bile tolerance (Atg22 family)
MTFTARELAPRRELVSWAMYDFANSGYTTVVLTAIFNTYFVAVIAGESSGLQPGTGTLLWSVAIGLSNMLILLTAPVLGAIADYSANKKRILAVSTLGCVAMTAMLAWSGPDLIVFTMVIIVGSAFLFGTSENFIAAFCRRFLHLVTWAESPAMHGRWDTWVGLSYLASVYSILSMPKGTGMVLSSTCQ